MKVVVPYTELHPDLPRVLRQDHIDARYVRMEDDLHYWRLLRELWWEGQSFIVVEHDILPWPGALQGLWECPEPWCAYPYYLSHDPRPTPALGCAKFGAALMADAPGMWDRLAEGRDFRCQGDPRHWWGLDGRIGLVLGEMGARSWIHRHEPPVLHLNRKRFP